MALINRQPGRVFRISTAPDEGVNTYILGDAHDGKIGTMMISLWAQAGFAGSALVKARPRNPEAAQPVAPPMPALPMPFQAIPYVLLSSGGTAAPPAWVIAPLTTTCIIEVPATGLAIALDVTAASAGEAWVFWWSVEGQAIAT